MRVVLKILVVAVAVVVVLGAGGFLWARSTAASVQARTVDAHRADFPIPFPLSPAEIEQLRAERAAAQGEVAAAPAGAAAAPAEAPPDPLAGVDLQKVALDRAIARGKHLVDSRYACRECHGKDLGGGTMIDDPKLGSLHGPNLTTAGVTAPFTAADWDRAVRHGILHDGRVSFMPTEDFKSMSDRELSDVVAFIRSHPPVQRVMPARTLGPLGTVLMATGTIRPGADSVPDHAASHAAEPPAEAPTPEFGRHLAQICTGCHRADLSGGKIASGDPSWPEASNLTPHETGLKGWTYANFEALMRQGVRPDGTKVQPPMALMPTFAAHMTETEMKALWAYLETVPAKEKGR